MKAQNYPGFCSMATSGPEVLPGLCNRERPSGTAGQCQRDQLPRILNSLQGSFDDERQKRIDRLQHYSLLVIDDLGVERRRPIPSNRSQRGRHQGAVREACDHQTNLSLKDLQNPPSLAYKRILRPGPGNVRSA